MAALPERGGNAVATSYSRYAGGAVNILVAAARSGADCVHAGAVGTGANGDLVRAALVADGVAVSSPAVPDLDTGICVVMVEPSAERTFVTTQGAERHITVESLQTAAPVAGDVVCLSGFSLVGRTRDPLLQWVAGLDPGVVVVLDPGDAFGGLDASSQEAVLAMTDRVDEQRRRGVDPDRGGGRGRLGCRRGRPAPCGCRGHRPGRGQGVPRPRGRPDRAPRRTSTGGGRHERRGRHPYRCAPGRAGPRRELARGGEEGERSRRDQGDAARPVHGTHRGGDRRLPREEEGRATGAAGGRPR